MRALAGFGIALVIAAVPTLLCCVVVWVRWRVRDRRRRRARLVERARQRDELERALRRLRLRVTS